MKPYLDALGALFYQGDCVEVMADLPADSFDTIITDPPYHLTAHKKGGTGEASVSDATPYGRARITAGFMGQQWDGGGVAFKVATWEAVLRVTKPGGMLLAFGGTRTYHRLTCAIEDAGWEVRDCLMWLYGSGFPKSLDISKAIDKQDADRKPEREAVGRWLRSRRETAGLKQKEVAAHWPSATGGLTGCVANWELGLNCPTWGQWLDLKRIVGFGDEMDAEVWRVNGRKGEPGEAWDEREEIGIAHRVRRESVVQIAGESDGDYPITAPATDAAKEWDGWGTALKPGWEPIILAMKPTDGTFAENAQRHGVAGLHIDGGRIGAVDGHGGGAKMSSSGKTLNEFGEYEGDGFQESRKGRWPANVLLTHHPECVETGTRKVKTGTAVNRNRGETRPLTVSGAPKKVEDYDTTHADPDGTETIAAWDCHEDCPVLLLDEQSGEGRARGNVTPTKRDPATSIFGVGGGPGGVDPGDTGGASRFFYSSKASGKDRGNEKPFSAMPLFDGVDSERLDGTEAIRYADPKWVNAVLKALLPAAMATSRKRATVGSGTSLSSGTAWSTCWCGSVRTDPFHPVIRSTIATATKSTTGSPTWKWSPRSHTRGCIAGVCSDAVRGTNPALCAERSSPWANETGICHPKVGRSTDDADLATSVASWLTSADGNGEPLNRQEDRVGLNTHPT